MQLPSGDDVQKRLLDYLWQGVPGFRVLYMLEFLITCIILKYFCVLPLNYYFCIISCLVSPNFDDAALVLSVYNI